MDSIQLDDDANDASLELGVADVGDSTAGDPVVAATRHAEGGTLKIQDDPVGRGKFEIPHLDGSIDADHHFSLPGCRDDTECVNGCGRWRQEQERYRWQRL